MDKSNLELAQVVTAALQSMITDGSYQAILKKWNLEESNIEHVTINGE